MSYTTVTLRQSDWDALGSNYRESLCKAAAIWQSMDETQKHRARQDSDKRDYMLRCTKAGATNPSSARSISFTTDVWRVVVDAGGDKNGKRFSAGLRTLCRLLKKPVPMSTDPQYHDVPSWQSVSIGLSQSVELRRRMPHMMEAGRFLALAMQVWDALPEAIRERHAKNSALYEWERRQPGPDGKKDSCVPFNIPLVRKQWLELERIGDGNRSRGARTVIRAFLLALDAT